MSLKRRAMEFYLRGFSGGYMSDKDTFITLGAIVAIGVVISHLAFWAIQSIGWVLHNV